MTLIRKPGQLTYRAMLLVDFDRGLERHKKMRRGFPRRKIR